MSGQRNEYLEQLKVEISKTRLGKKPSKPSKPSFESFEGSHPEVISKIGPAPMDADGVPCGGCPGCGQGEFWRWPKFHPQYDPAGWRCCFCDPIPRGSGPCDFCGVPDSMLKHHQPTTEDT